MSFAVHSNCAASDGDDDETLCNFEPCDESCPDSGLKNAMKLAWADRLNADLKAAVRELKEKNQCAEKEILDLKKELAEAKSDVEAVTTGLEKHRHSENEALQLRIAELEVADRDKEAEISRLKAENRTLNLAVDGFRAGNEAQSSRSRDLEETVKGLRAEVQRAREKRGAFHAEIDTMKAEKDKALTERVAANAETEAAKAAKLKVFEALNQARKERDAARAERDTAQAQRTSSVGEINEFMKEKNALLELLGSVVVDLDIVDSGDPCWICKHPDGLHTISKKSNNIQRAFRAYYAADTIFYRLEDEAIFMHAYKERQTYHQNHAYYHEAVYHNYSTSRAELYDMCKFSLCKSYFYDSLDYSSRRKPPSRDV
jgi:DNA repair exonuclease SbcCD ATPase subunit